MKLLIKNGITPKGRVSLPPSKSEAVRAALLLGLCGGDPMRAVENYPARPLCDDVMRALAAADTAVPVPDAGSSAALLRMLVPVRLALYGRADIRADERLAARGMQELERCLGAEVRFDNGMLSMEKTLSSARYEIDCSRSSQFLSGLLIALPLLPRECEIVVRGGLVSKGYADMTLRFARLFGARVEETEEGFVTHPSRYTEPVTIPVFGDLSYAAVFRAMNALGGEVEISGMTDDPMQPDGRFYELAGLPDADVADCPDLMPVLAACACGRKADTVIRGAGRLAFKESDRLRGMERLISDLGGEAYVLGDALVVRGRGGLHGGECSAQGDHRLCFAAAALAAICDKPVTLCGAESVTKSAPRFWEDYSGLDGDIIEVTE